MGFHRSTLTGPTQLVWLPRPARQLGERRTAGHRVQQEVNCRRPRRRRSQCRSPARFFAGLGDEMRGVDGQHERFGPLAQRCDPLIGEASLLVIGEPTRVVVDHHNAWCRRLVRLIGHVAIVPRPQDVRPRLRRSATVRPLRDSAKVRSSAPGAFRTTASATHRAKHRGRGVKAGATKVRAARRQPGDGQATRPAHWGAFKPSQAMQQRRLPRAGRAHHQLGAVHPSRHHRQRAPGAGKRGFPRLLADADLQREVAPRPVRCDGDGSLLTEMFAHLLDGPNTIETLTLPISAIAEVSFFAWLLAKGVRTA